MEVPYLLTFVGGMAVGIVLAMVFLTGTKGTPQHNVGDLDPTVSSATCQMSGADLDINGSAPATVGDLELVNLYAEAFSPLPNPIPAKPGGMALGKTFPISCPAAGASGHVVVWAEYRGFGKSAGTFYECPPPPPPPPPPPGS